MSKTAVLWEKLKKTRLIALLNPQNDAECVTAYETLDPEGVVLEIAFRSPFAATGIKAVLEKYPDAVLLAGTVMTRNQAESAITAGAAGIVSADFIPEVVEVCVDQNIMCIPGGIWVSSWFIKPLATNVLWRNLKKNTHINGPINFSLRFPEFIPT